MSEFTGERVIPGQVGVDLWNEHMARYAFAARFAAGGRVLDLGCGTGYGTAALAQMAREAVGVDVAEEAIEYARTSFPLANVEFIRSSATSVALPDASFDLITAFEIIEHIADWAALIREARRLLRAGGLFLVSTPNVRYYAESRGETGPNPYHVHEFEYGEFASALGAAFPNVQVLLQNRVEAFAFHPYRVPWPATARVEGSAGGTDDAHFFLGVCSIDRALDEQAFVYVPRAANLLREREQHVTLLENELQQNKEWLRSTQEEHGRLLALHADQKQQLEEHNRWGIQLERDWKAGLERISALQQEVQKEQTAAQAVVAQYESKVRDLEAENEQKTRWARDTEARLGAEVEARTSELRLAVDALHATESELESRTRWAQSLEADAAKMRAMLNFVRESRWVKLGRIAGIGPKVTGE
ncbi:MAG: methyltransferase domain-containing protein [Bryobacteraceae bacterium]